MIDQFLFYYREYAIGADGFAATVKNISSIQMDYFALTVT